MTPRDPDGPDRHRQREPDEAVQAALVPLGRRLPLDAHRQPDRQQPARQLRLHRAVHGPYATPGAGARSTGTGLDFADFLLGMSQQATLQYGPGTIRFRSRAWSLFFQDDWRVNAKFTINAGVRYEYLTPYWEANNHLVNLDAQRGLHRRRAGPGGPDRAVHGRVPDERRRPGSQQPRAAHRAWRGGVNSKTVVRGGYGINYSSPVYQSMAQRLAAQPPFATTDTRLGTLGGPLLLADGASRRRHRHGHHQQLRRGAQLRPRLGADVERRPAARPRRARSTWASATPGTRGASLDIQRAPNRGANGLAIADVQPFIWESSGGHSIMHAAVGAAAEAAGEGFRRRAHLHAVEVDGQRVDDRRRRRRGGAERQGPRGGVGRCRASTSGTASPANFNIELPFGREPALADRRASAT